MQINLKYYTFMALIILLTGLSQPVFSLDNGFTSGDEHRANMSTYGIQSRASVAGNGINFFVVWDAYSLGGVQGRIVDALGNPTSHDKLVYIGDYAQRADIASDGTNYMVTVSTSTTAESWEIKAKMLDTEGNVVGSAISVNQSVPSIQWNSKIASNGLSYLIVWEHKVADNNYDIYGRLYDLTGSPITDEFCINIHQEMDQLDVAVESDGTDYFVAWDSEYDDGSVWGKWNGVRGRVVSSSGVLASTETIFSTGSQRDPELAFDGTNFLVSWVDWSQNGVFGRFFSTSGSLYPTFKIDTDANYNQYNPSIAFNGVNYCVIWSRYDVLVPSGIDPNIYAQMFTTDTAGVKLGSEFMVPFITVEKQYTPSIASLGSNFLTAWENNEEIAVRYLASDTLVIIEQPQNRTVEEGYNATFTVTAITRGYPISYQWYADGDQVGFDNDTFVIEDVYTDNDGVLIHCVVSDSQGSTASNQAVLSVLTNNSFTISIEGVDTLTENSSTYYTAKAVYVHNTVDITSDATWSVSGSTAVNIQIGGFLSVTEMIIADQTITVRADYDNGVNSEFAEKTVVIDNLFQILGVSPSFDDAFSAEPVAITIVFSEPIDPVSVTSGSENICGAGVDNLFGTPDDVLYSPTIEIEGNFLTYNLSDGVVSLSNDLYRITIVDITNQVGDVLDGENVGSFPSGDRIAGGAYVIDFAIERAISSFAVNDNSTVSLEWLPFKDGLVYTVKQMNEGVWQAIEPVSQWPITATSWSGGVFEDDTKIRLYKVTGARQ